MPKSRKDKRRAKCDSAIKHCQRIEDILTDLYMEVGGRDELREEMLSTYLVFTADLKEALAQYRQTMT